MRGLAPEASDSSFRTAGTWAAIGAFGLWGVLPLYWKQMEGIAALELIGHRVVWSLVLRVILVRGRGRAAQFRAAVRAANRRELAHVCLGGLIWLGLAGCTVDGLRRR
jgi:chloramphenicol-sensitive protein RarD